MTTGQMLHRILSEGPSAFLFNIGADAKQRVRTLNALGVQLTIEDIRHPHLDIHVANQDKAESYRLEYIEGEWIESQDSPCKGWFE